MSKKSVKTEKEVAIDPKRDGIVVYEKRPEQSRSIWDAIFSCQGKEEAGTCKKVRFKWVC